MVFMATISYNKNGTFTFGLVPFCFSRGHFFLKSYIKQFLISRLLYVRFYMYFPSIRHGETQVRENHTRSYIMLQCFYVTCSKSFVAKTYTAYHQNNYKYYVNSDDCRFFWHKALVDRIFICRYGDL